MLDARCGGDSREWEGVGCKEGGKALQTSVRCSTVAHNTQQTVQPSAMHEERCTIPGTRYHYFLSSWSFLLCLSHNNMLLLCRLVCKLGVSIPGTH